MICFGRKPLIVLWCVLIVAGSVVTRAEAATPKPGPKAELYAADYREMEKPGWKTSFPRLGRYEILAPFTAPAGKKGAYNCIAHTLRIYHQWVWPGKKVADFDRLYGSHGYRRIRTKDYSYSPTVDKIVLYAKVFPDGRIECTHGARQLADGTWTSKLGMGPLIRHATPLSVSGPSYGQPLAVYVKTRRTPPVLPSPSRPPTNASTKLAGLTGPVKQPR